MCGSVRNRATVQPCNRATVRLILSVRWTVILLNCAALQAAIGNIGPGFTAHGRLTYTNYLVASEHYTIDYTVYAKPPLWKITASQFGERGFGHTEHGYDGKHLYSITYYNKQAISQARADTNVSYFVNGKVLPHEIPPFDPVRAIHIWFAYMGFQTASENELPAIGCKLTSGRQIPKCYRTIVCTTNLDRALGMLIVSGEVRDAGYDYDTDGNAFKLFPPFDNGYTPLVFKIAFPEDLNQGVPDSYAFTARIPNTAGAAGGVTDVWTLAGQTTSVEEGVEIRDFRPEIVDRAYVWDYVNHIEYMTQSGWIGPGSPGFNQMMERKKQEQHRLTARVIVLVFMAATTIVPIAFLLVRRVSSRKS